MLAAVMPRRLAVAAAVFAVAASAVACGEEGIQLAKDDPNYEGAKLFQQHCSSAGRCQPHGLRWVKAKGGG